jgi:hypothetical protein
VTEVEPTIKKCVLTADDVTRYQLPSDFTKAPAARRAAFVEGTKTLRSSWTPDPLMSSGRALAG